MPLKSKDTWINVLWRGSEGQIEKGQGHTRSARERTVKVMQNVTLLLVILHHVGTVNKLNTLKVCCFGTLVLGVGEVAVAACAKGIRIRRIEANKNRITNN